MGSQVIQPVYKNVQNLALYETKTRFYIVGSNNSRTKFRILKIDRTEPTELVIYDDQMEYTHKQVKDLLSMIASGNKNSTKSNSGITLTASAFGIVGFVRFLEGYYIILITERRPVARIGYHVIYKIEDTTMIYIPNTSDNKRADEVRYVKTFMNVDLSSNFYFSYSYDLTHTLQYNSSPFQSFPKFTDKTNPNKDENGSTSKKGIGVFTKPEWKFVWNEYLLEKTTLHSYWKIYVIHGFVAHSNISVFGKTLAIILIGRRSQKYAGTRFLKRGANLEGDVANEVETEQILWDTTMSSLSETKYSSFVQMRGSVPFQWSQDVTKMMPKPQIILDSVDPYCQSAGQHFGSLLNQYGAPIILLNLVKKRETKPHESILTKEYLNSIEYLNQFLPEEFHIKHIGFDMARGNKQKDANVLERLSDISHYTMKKIGFFQNWGTLNCHELTSMNKKLPNRFPTEAEGFYQVGVVRVNCVDCLDRTNTAQFALGRCALAYQLHSLGLIEEPRLEFETDIVKVLEALYEDHGDTLALQYGGSQLVHRVKTYRKIAPLSSHSRDIMQTLSRYYSNTFSDAEKQNGINLFLGIFRPFRESIPLWEHSTDYYFHNPISLGKRPCCRNTFTNWWGKFSTDKLPLPLNQANKGITDTVEEVIVDEATDEKFNGFQDYYRPHEMTYFDDLHSYIAINNVTRDFVTPSNEDFGPFSFRTRIGKRKESHIPANPSVTGISSTSSGNSDSESGTTDEEDELQFLEESEDHGSSNSSLSLFSFKSQFSSMKEVYGVEIVDPSDSDKAIYRRYVSISQIACVKSEKTSKRSFNLIQQTAFSLDSTYNVTPPTIYKKSKDIYRNYIIQKESGPQLPSKDSLLLYQQFASSRFG